MRVERERGDVPLRGWTVLLKLPVLAAVNHLPL